MDVQNLYLQDRKSSQGEMTGKLRTERAEALASKVCQAQGSVCTHAQKQESVHAFRHPFINLLVHASIHSTDAFPAPTMCQAPF